MGILSKIRLVLGLSYNKHDHSYQTDKIKEGELKQIGKNEFIHLRKGRVHFCYKDKKGVMKCKRTPIKIGKKTLR